MTGLTGPASAMARVRSGSKPRTHGSAMARPINVTLRRNGCEVLEVQQLIPYPPLGFPVGFASVQIAKRTHGGKNSMRFGRLSRPVFAVLFFTLTSASIVRAQDYPVRTVTIIVPFAAGGSTDKLAHVLAPKLGQRLGKPFVIENRPGDGTVSAATTLAKMTPDGYTLMQATSATLAMNVTIYKNLPDDPAKEIVSVATSEH
jgi:hypothetical protein